MGAYDTLEKGIEGLKYGLDGRIEGGWACAEALGIKFGRPVFGHVGDAVNAYNFSNDVGKIVFDADFSTGDVITITINGVAAADVTYATSHANTVLLVNAAVSLLTGVICITDTTDGTGRTFLIQIKGETALVTENVVGGGAATGIITYGSSMVYVGISLMTQNSVTVGSSTENLYEQHDAMNVMVEGKVWCLTKGIAKANNEAYVYTTEGVDQGKVGSSGTAIPARFRSNAADGALVLVFTEGQVEMTYAGLF